MVFLVLFLFFLGKKVNIGLLGILHGLLLIERIYFSWIVIRLSVVDLGLVLLSNSWLWEEHVVVLHFGTTWE